MYPDDGQDAETLMANAQTARRHCREALGVGEFAFYSEKMNEESRLLLMIDTNLRHSIDERNFACAYQPIVDIESGELCSIEALFRSGDDILKNMPVQLVIEAAERSGLIIELGERLLRQSTEQMSEWIKSGFSDARLSLNLSPIQLRDNEAAERITQIVSRLSFPPRLLQFEITETAFIEDICVVKERLQRLQGFGVRIALDDFGTGHSALSHLREFRPDTIKIDRSFINIVYRSYTDSTLVSAIILMARQMGIEVVAEGVETQEQLERLKQLKCNAYQGYLISKPMYASSMSHWLSEHGRPNRSAA